MTAPSPTTNVKAATSTASAAVKTDATAAKSPKVVVKKLINVGDQLRKLPAPSFRQVKVTNTKATSVGLIGRLTFGDLDKPRTVNEDHSVALTTGAPDHGLSGDTTTDATVGEDEPFTVSIGGTRRKRVTAEGHRRRFLTELKKLFLVLILISLILFASSLLCLICNALLR